MHLIERFVFGGDVLRLGLHQVMLVVETALVLDPVLLVRDVVTGHQFLREPHNGSKESRESLELTKETSCCGKRRTGRHCVTLRHWDETHVGTYAKEQESDEKWPHTRHDVRHRG